MTEKNKFKNSSVIAFDADDTLWVNEPYFRASEERFCELFSEYLPLHDAERALLKIEIANIPKLGYGIKSFIISMIETAMSITNGNITGEMIEKIIAIGSDQLEKPIEIIDGVEEVLNKLQSKYKLILATKGDLLEQEKKLNKSGLENYFHHIEILSEKKKPNYSKLIKHLDIPAHEFLMIGNSLKSDILPIIELGGWAIHIPFHTTWEYEKIDSSIDHPQFLKLDRISEILKHL